MVSLYRDPMGEKIFDTSNPAIIMDSVPFKSGMLTQQVMGTESEQVTKLQNRIKELERELANSNSKVHPESEQVTKLQNRIEELERELANSNSKVHPESEQVTKLQNRIKELERELANLKNVVCS